MKCRLTLTASRAAVVVATAATAVARAFVACGDGQMPRHRWMTRSPRTLTIGPSTHQSALTRARASIRQCTSSARRVGVASPRGAITGSPPSEWGRGARTEDQVAVTLTRGLLDSAARDHLGGPVSTACPCAHHRFAQSETSPGMRPPRTQTYARRRDAHNADRLPAAKRGGMGIRRSGRHEHRRLHGRHRAEEHRVVRTTLWG